MGNKSGATPGTVCHPHSLGPPTLTVRARTGVNIPTVAHIAGHASLSTTSVYSDDSLSDAAEAMDPLGRA